MNYQGQKEFLDFYIEHTNQKTTTMYTWNLRTPYRFFVKSFKGIIKAHSERGEGRYSQDFTSFNLDAEDLKYLYDKYKPLVEKYECELKKKELEKLERNLITYKKDIEKLKLEQCKDV